jgi:hypothetical protein
MTIIGAERYSSYEGVMRSSLHGRLHDSKTARRWRRYDISWQRMTLVLKAPS